MVLTEKDKWLVENSTHVRNWVYNSHTYLDCSFNIEEKLVITFRNGFNSQEHFLLYFESVEDLLTFRLGRESKNIILIPGRIKLDDVINKKELDVLLISKGLL